MLTDRDILGLDLKGVKMVRSRDFHATSAFAASLGCSWSGARLHHSAAGRSHRHRCPPSALYTFLGLPVEAWLGVSSGACGAQGLRRV